MPQNVKVLYVHTDTWNRLDDLCKAYPEIKKVHFADRALRKEISVELIKREMEGKPYDRSTSFDGDERSSTPESEQSPDGSEAGKPVSDIDAIGRT